jgi:uncharacterized membrane protein
MGEKEQTTKEVEVSNRNGTQVVRESTETDSTAETRLTLVNAIWLLLGILEVLLLFRFVLKLFGANPGSGFVEFVYTISGIFVAPFQAIFSTPTAEGDIVVSVFETGTVVAMVVYALVVWGITRLMTLNRR